MSNVDERDAEFLLETHQLVLHLLTELQVKCSERLIEEQYSRLIDYRSCHCDSLLLTARKLVYAPVFKAFEVYQFKSISNFFLYFSLRSVLYPKTECNILSHCHVREKRVILEHGIYRTLIRRKIRDILALKIYPAFVRLFKTGNYTECSSFTAS